MDPRLPPPPQPDALALAHGQARLLAELSRLQSAAPTDPTELQGDESQRPAETTQAPWLGPQAAWEAAGPAERPAEPATRRYRFAEVFARGGLGTVRRADDRKLGRTVAIKELLRFDDKAVQRFAREAAITARLQHPGIIALYDLGRDELGRPFLCMRLVEGGSLEQRLAASPDLAARLALLPHVIAAADAVAYAHRHRVIHRDLKPANILIGEFGEAVVIDWGLAKDLSQGPDVEGRSEEGLDTVSDVTAAGSLLGTIRYMPPEQARGETVDARSDVYALGAVLYHLVAGVPPFHDLRSAELLHAALTRRPTPLLTQVPAAPRALAAIVARAMERDPAARYASAEAFAEDLRRFAAGRLVGAHDYSPAEIGRLWLRRHRGVAAVASVSLVMLGVLGGLAFVRVDAERDRAEAALQTAELERDGAEQARVLAEQRAEEAGRARAFAEQSADLLRLEQARTALANDPAAAIRGLAQLSPAPDNAAPARLLALAAQARGLPTMGLEGPRSAVLDVQSLADGTVFAREHSGGVWRWSPGAKKGEEIASDGVVVISPGGAHWARVTRAVVELHRAGELVKTLAVALQRPPVFYRWRLHDDARTLIGASEFGASALIVDLSDETVEVLPGADAPAQIATGRLHVPSINGRRVAALHGKDRLVVWDRDSGAVRSARLPAASCGAPEFGGDGSTVLVRCKDRMFVWPRDGVARVIDARWAVLVGERVVLLATGGDRQTLWAEPLAGGPPLWTRAVRADDSVWAGLAPLLAGDAELVRAHFGDAWEVFDAATGAVRYTRVGDWHAPLWFGRGAQLFVAAAGGDVVHRLERIDLSLSPWSRPAPAATPGGPGPAAISPNATFAARQTRNDARVERLDLRAGLVALLPAGCGAWASQPHQVEAVDDDGRVMLADNRGHACVWDASGVHPLALPDGHVHDLAFAPDGVGVSISLAIGTMFTWDHPDAAPRESAAQARFYSPDGAVEVLVEARAARLLRRGEAPMTLPLPGSESAHGLRLAFTPDSRGFALYHPDAAEVVVVDTLEGETRHRLSAPRPIDTTIGGQRPRFSPSGQVLALADGDRLYWWTLTDPVGYSSFDGLRALGFVFTPDERALIVMDESGDLSLVDPVAGVQAPLRDETGNGSPSRLAPTSDGAVLMTGTGEVLRWQDTLPRDGEELRKWLSRSALGLPARAAGQP
jgi:hypothetical protein